MGTIPTNIQPFWSRNLITSNRCSRKASLTKRFQSTRNRSTGGETSFKAIVISSAQMQLVMTARLVLTPTLRKSTLRLVVMTWEQLQSCCKDKSAKQVFNQPISYEQIYLFPSHHYTEGNGLQWDSMLIGNLFFHIPGNEEGIPSF